MVHTDDAMRELERVFTDNGLAFELITANPDGCKYKVTHENRVFNTGFNSTTGNYGLVVDNGTASGGMVEFPDIEEFTEKFLDYVYMITSVLPRAMSVAGAYSDKTGVQFVMSQFGSCKSGGYMYEFAPLGDNNKDLILHIMSVNGDWMVVQCLKWGSAKARTVDMCCYSVRGVNFVPGWTIDALEYALKLRCRSGFVGVVHNDDLDTIFQVMLSGERVELKVIINETGCVSYSAVSLNGNPVKEHVFAPQDPTDISLLDISVLELNECSEVSNDEELDLTESVQELGHEEEDVQPAEVEKDEEYEESAEGVSGVDDYEVYRLILDGNTVGLRFIYGNGDRFDIYLDRVQEVPFPLSWVEGEIPVIRKHGLKYTKDELDSGVVAEDISDFTDRCMEMLAGIFE